MADQKYSINTHTGNGSRLTWPISFAGGYLSRSHVKAHVSTGDDDIVYVPFTWVGDYEIQISPPVAAGKTLTIYRDTPKDAPLVDYSDAGVLDEPSLDRSARQSVFIAAEMVDKYGPVSGLSGAVSGIYAKIAEEVSIWETENEAVATRTTLLEAAMGEAEAAILTEQQARVTAISAEATARQALTARVSTAEAAIVTEATVRATAVSAEATARQALAARVDTAEAAITTEATTRATAISAEATARQTLAARVTTTEDDLDNLGTRVTDAEADIVQEASTRASAISAEASARTALAARVTTTESSLDDLGPRVTAAEAAITSEVSARATAVSAEASARTALAARVTTTEDTLDDLGPRVTTAEAAIVTEASARASADSAIASTVTSLSTTVGEHTSTLTEYGESIDGLSAKYGVKLDVNGYVTGFEQNNDGETGDFVIWADKFKIKTPGTELTPFEVDGSVVKMGSVEVDTLKVGSVTTDALGANAAVIPVQVSADDAVAPSSTSLTVDIVMPAAGWIHISGFCNMIGDGVNRTSNIKVKVGGVTKQDIDGGVLAGAIIPYPIATGAYVAAGTHTITLDTSGSNSNLVMQERSLLIIGYPKTSA